MFAIVRMNYTKKEKDSFGNHMCTPHIYETEKVNKIHFYPLDSGRCNVCNCGSHLVLVCLCRCNLWMNWFPRRTHRKVRTIEHLCTFWKSLHLHKLTWKGVDWNSSPKCYKMQTGEAISTRVHRIVRQTDLLSRLKLASPRVRKKNWKYQHRKVLMVLFWFYYFVCRSSTIALHTTIRQFDGMHAQN